MMSNHLSKTANSTTHGLTSDILRCRVHKCFYWEVCPLQAHLEDCLYGYRCPVEIERFKVAYSGYEKSLHCYIEDIGEESIKDLIYKLAITEIKAMRADNALALVAAMPGWKGKVNSGPSPSLIWRYRSELYIKRNRLFAQIQQLRAGSPPSC